jgi:hypothetical protein
MAEDVFDVPLSLGSVGRLAEQTSAVLASAHAEDALQFILSWCDRPQRVLVENAELK